MALDLFKNFAKGTVSTGYDASATSVVLSGGHGAKLPTAPFNATWWNSSDYPDPSDDPNVEIVRVTNIATDTLTVTRGQEGTSASTKNTAGKVYRMVAGITAKTVNDDLSSLLAQIASGRLTLESGVGVSSMDQTAKTTIYYTPYKGNRIGLYEGGKWVLYSFTELSLALGTLADASNYDVFVFSNAGTLTLSLSAAWTSNVARADALVMQDGIYVKTGSTTHRYVGTFRTTSTTTTEDSAVKRLVWNNDNRVPREGRKVDTTAHSYSGTERFWNNNAANKIEFVYGLSDSSSLATVSGYVGGGVARILMIGLDSSTANYRTAYGYDGQSAGDLKLNAMATVEPLLGYHYISAIEQTAGLAAVTFTNFELNVLHSM